jgi:uncharacterized protein (DUF4415 family)
MRFGRKRNEEIAALRKMKDGQIDKSDVPELADWSGAVVGRFYRPVKQPVTIRIDADVLAWLKSKGKGYQTRINRLFRAAMRQGKTARRS